MKYFLYVSVMVALSLCVHVSHSSENRGQLVLIAGRDRNATLQNTGRLVSCSFVAKSLNDSVDTSMMEVIRDVNSPAFLVLKTGKSAHISITTDEQGRTHIHEKTTEIEGLKKQLRRAQASKDRARESCKQAETKLRILQEKNDIFEEKKQKYIRIAKRAAIGTGVGLAGAVLISWYRCLTKTTQGCCD